MNNLKTIPSVNFHLWQPCNMQCGFCFAKFHDVKRSVLPKGHLPKYQALQVVNLLAEFGFDKITFVGGEPTLCPWISDLIKCAKLNGMVTMLVTNGAQLTQSFLQENQVFLDWIGISVDSFNQLTNQNIGRVIRGKGVDISFYQSIFENIAKYNYRIKLNTVVNRFNFQENMLEPIQKIKPERWKVFKVLRIVDQNDQSFDNFNISDVEFNDFINRHKSISYLVKENNQDMTGSYIMIDPAGRFFDNEQGKHHYSSPILEVGIQNSLQQVRINFQKFIDRKGMYAW